MNIIDVSIPFVFMQLLFLFDQYEYTKLSFALVLYGLCHDKTRLLPLIFINSTSVCISFHFSLLLDNNVFDKFCERWDMNVYYFWSMNVVVHVLPMFLLLYVVRIDKLKGEWYYGVYTSSFHLLWCITVNNSLDLSNLYVYMETHQWYILWSITVVTHLVTSMILSA